MTTITKKTLIEHITRQIDMFHRQVKARPLGDNSYQHKSISALEVALSSLEAKPIGAFHIFDQQVSGTSDCVPDGEWPIDEGVIEVYAAPPVPVVLDEAQSRELFEKWCPVNIERNKWHTDQYEHLPARQQWNAWNACRAAMLKAKPVSPAYKLHDGWVSCSGRLPDTDTYVLVSNGFWVGMGKYSDAEYLGTGENWQDEHGEFIDLIHHPVTHWMPLPAAPQQEASND